MKKKGEFGYIQDTKAHNFKLAMIMLLIALSVFIFGKALLPKMFNYFAVVAALLMLPVAQCITRYLVFKGFKSIKKQLYEKLTQIDQEVLLLYDLILVFSKKTIQSKVTAIINDTIIVYIEDNKKEKNKELAEEVINKILEKNKIKAKLEIIVDEEAYIDRINKLFEENKTILDNQLQDNLAEILLLSSI